MHFGVVFPHDEIDADSGAIKEFAQAVEALGYDHILAADHVVGANKATRPDWRGPYHLESIFHEPFVLFSYMAGVTTQIGFATGILILPQRQTALVAKQAACLDVLCKGRFRLGIGTGWNDVEYEALGMSFANRGKIFDDQIDVLRALWTQPAVTFKTPFHSITDAGINPLPVQRPIPIWFGGGGTHPVFSTPNVDKVSRRIARVGDGWMPSFQPDDQGAELMAKFRGYCREYGRDPAGIGLEGFVVTQRKTESNWGSLISAWQGLGATHIAINSMYDGLQGVEQHVRRLEEVRSLLPKSAAILSRV
jgi:probable F420-dependent oxidoreductase